MILKSFVSLCALAIAAGAQSDVEIGGVTEKHVMVPMRDGTKLSVYLYVPKGAGPWPVLFEQRYASTRSEGSRQTYARLASHGYVVAAENFRGTQLSEGRYNGYRALQWGELRDGYDTVEWLAKQPWSTGKIGTFGGSQAGYAQNFLAITQPPHLVAYPVVVEGVGDVVPVRQEHQLHAAHLLDPPDERRRKPWRVHQHVPAVREVAARCLGSRIDHRGARGQLEVQVEIADGRQEGVPHGSSRSPGPAAAL